MIPGGTPHAEVYPAATHAAPGHPSGQPGEDES